jgi:hypothetical protein
MTKTCSKPGEKKGSCSCVKFKGRAPIWMCSKGKKKGKKGPGHKVCHAGGADWRAQIKANKKKGLSFKKMMAPARFVAC